MRSPTGIIPGVKQEHLGPISAERPASVGLIMGVQLTGRNGEPVPRGICWDRGGAGLVAGVKGGGLASFSGNYGRGGKQASSYRLYGPAEVPPSGVDFCAACHPVNRDDIPSRGGLTAGHAPPGTI